MTNSTSGVRAPLWLLILDWTLLSFAGLIGWMILTGGTRFTLAHPHVELDLSLTSGWVLVLLLGLLIKSRLRRNVRVCGGDLTDTVLDSVLAWFCHPTRGTGRSLGLLAFFGLLLVAGHVARHWSLNTSWEDLTCVHQALAFPFGFASEAGDFALLRCDTCPNGTFMGAHLAYSESVNAFETAG